jgi:hypothetical protein
MKKIVWGIAILAPILGLSALMAQSTPPKVIAEFSGSSLKWVRTAEPEFERKNLDLDKYTISVVEQNDSVTVALTSSDSVKGARGSSGSFLGFVVEINKKDMKIVRSNYIR